MYVSGLHTGPSQAALLWRAAALSSQAPVRPVEAAKLQQTSSPDERWMYQRAMRGAENVANQLEQTPDL
jgi:hypothetical protein